MNPLLENTIKTYDFTAANYAHDTDKLLPQEKLDDFIFFMRKPGDVLELGCGPGRDAEYFASKGSLVVGVDLSEELLKIARQRVPSEVFLNLDFSEPFPDSLPTGFNGVWASASYVHIPREKLEFSLRQIHDRLAPEGLFYMSVMEGQGTEIRVSKRYGDAPGKGEKFWQYFCPIDLLSTLREVGFDTFHYTTSPNKQSPNHPWIDFLARKR
ncbi:class I SAM-dependent methyltransferase [Candidatus Pacearchaeota archaeon]|nr:class I SAM-dependent methyltransferase [Candidatus Pacearchaeota archaeon]